MIVSIHTNGMYMAWRWNMARNKYPEQTVEKILEVSLKLFSEKGYEKTTMQDIVNALGMSKGAIYHHFKSKEELVDAVSTYSFMKRNSFVDVYELKHLNGLQKLRWVLMNEFSNTEKQEVDRFTAPLAVEPNFMMKMIQDTITHSVPMLIPMIEESKQDGSSQVEDVQMTAEIFMVLANVWANPLFWEMSEEQFAYKVKTIGKILDTLGLPVINEEAKQTMIEYYKNILPK